MSKKEPTAAEIAEMFGFDIEEVEARMPKKVEKARKEADAVRHRLYNPDEWYDIQCKYCGRMFSADYKYVALCSDDCRKADFAAIGLVWDAARTEDQRYIAMKIDPPGIVPPAALSALLQLARQYSASALINPGVHTQT
jgi:hypothetical protein